MIKTNNFDLEDRTARFGENIIIFCKNLHETNINRSLISQLIRSATSIGANYCEANGASSRKDFKNKIHICKKETIETKHWLRMIAKSNPEVKNNLRIFWKEAQELTLIFSKVISSLKLNH